MHSTNSIVYILATTIPAVSVEVSQDPVNIGDNIDIRCACSGTHNPRYYWSRPNHSNLPQNAQVHGNTLRLSNVTVSDSGLYRCTADTPDGTFEQDFNLVVHGKVSYLIILLFYLFPNIPIFILYLLVIQVI